MLEGKKVEYSRCSCLLAVECQIGYRRLEERKRERRKEDRYERRTFTSKFNSTNRSELCRQSRWHHLVSSICMQLPNNLRTTLTQSLILDTGKGIMQRKNLIAMKYLSVLMTFIAGKNRRRSMPYSEELCWRVEVWESHHDSVERRNKVS